MNRRLPLFLGALTLATTFAVSMEEAEAGRGRVRFSGGMRWRGGVHVSVPRFSRPAWQPHRWSVGGSIYVGPRVNYYPRPYYVYYPTVPSYYSYYQQSYYPVQPAVYQGPGAVAVTAPRQPLPRFGIGLFAGGSAVEAQDGGSTHQSDDIGLLGRFRLTPGLLLEGELGKTSYDDGNFDNVRVDRRLGASLVYELGARNRWAPYVLAGVGVQQADVAGEFQTTQDFVELGVGVRVAVTPRFHLAADIRAGSRGTVSSDGSAPPHEVMTAPGTSPRIIQPPTEQSDESEEYTRARLSAIMYF